MWDTVRPGDTVIITEPSRLSRSVQQFCAIVETIKTKRIRLQILGSITIDCRTNEPDPMLGRPPITAERIPDSFFRYLAKYQIGEINVSELARLAQISRPTAYRYLSAVNKERKGN